MPSSAKSDELVLSPADLQAKLDEVSSDITADNDDSSLDGNDVSDLSTAISEDDDLVIPSVWDDDGETDEEATSDQQETESPKAAKSKAKPETEEPAGKTMKVRADGKVHDVDLANEAELRKLLSYGLAAPRVMTEVDKLRKEVADSKATWAKYEKMTPERLIELKTGKSFNDYVKGHVDRQKAYESASEEERRLMDLKAQTEQMDSKRSAEVEAYEAKLAAADARVEQAEIKEMKSVLYPEFYRHSFTGKVTDAEVAKELNDTLWTMAVTNLERKYGHEDDLPIHAVRAEFARVAKMLDGNAKAAAKRELTTTITEKKKTAKETAQLASQKNYAKGMDPAKAAKLAKDPVALFRSLVGKK